MVHSSSASAPLKPSKKKAPRARLDRREAILQGAREVLARKGMAATMADVAKAAQVSHGLAYRYFADKEALVAALVGEAVVAGRNGVNRIAAMTGTPGERLELLIASVLNSRRTQPELFQLLQQMRDDSVPKKLRALVETQGRHYHALLKRLIAEGQSRGEVADGDPDQLALAVMATLDGLSHLAAREPDMVARHFPDIAIVLRLIKPAGRRRTRGEGPRLAHE